ncbi:MAG: hypothetical protein IJN90_00535 [Bacilli bacterium]|nr:hypothetical protein [Bacilli bacterium]
MKKKIIILISIFIVIISLSFISTYFNDLKYKEKISNIKNDILLYLENKYNEKFDIIEFSYTKNTYDTYENEELVTKEMESSFIYTFRMSSARLIEFIVTYVVYENEEEYINYKNLDIMEAGLYENYIYEYKIRDIKREVKNDIYDLISGASSLDIYINYFKDDYTLMRYSLDSDLKKEKIEYYNKLDKKVSNFDWYKACVDINDNYTLVFDIEINDYITKTNLKDFKKEVKDLVLYLEELGYYNYEINFSFKNYVKATASRYIEEDDDIYLIFDYKENYSDIDESEKLTAYIIEK